VSNAVKVGAFFVVALLVAGWLVLRIENFRLGEGRGTQYVVTLPEARGLREKAAVLMRGIRVGRVTNLRLTADGVAADLQLRGDIRVRQGAVAEVIPVGLLGETQMNLDPGPPDAPELPPGAVIPGKIAPSMDALMETAGEVTADVTAITEAAREAVTGPAGENRMEQVLENLAALTLELRGFTKAMTQVAARVERLTGGQEDRLAQGVQDATLAARSVREAADGLDVVLERVRNGEGTVGRLLSDEGTALKLDETLVAFRDTALSLQGALGAAGGFGGGRFQLGFRAEYLTSPAQGAAYVSLEYRPSKVHFLRVEGIGIDDGFTASAMLGQRLEPWTIRLGLLRASPGLGADLMLLGQRLRLSAEAWDFGRAQLLPHGRLEAAVYPLRSVFLLAGWDDLLNTRQGLDQVFFGAGFHFGADGATARP
jgi:phospholipid/cholesterol/gamma-HCH transport system substrate-binding protein